MGTLLKNFNVLVVWAIITTMGATFSGAGEQVDTSTWKFKLAGEERFRAEYKRDFDFDDNRKDNGSIFNQRLRIGMTASLLVEEQDPKVDIFVEGLDAQTIGYKIKGPRNQEDDFDLHQAYVNIHKVLATNVAVKAGRQEIKYGKGRLLGAPSWSNRIRSFDAGVFHYDNAGWLADVFYGQDLKYDDGQFNTSRSEEFITGFYGGYQKDKKAPLVETYFLTLKDIKGTSDILRYTAGARLQTNIGKGIVVDIEVPYQFGHTGSASVAKKKIKAYAYHLDVSRSWESARWKPKLAIAYDEASGDNDPNDSVNNTFIPLYQSTHESYGQLDLFRWQNVRNPEVSVTFAPTEKFKFTPAADFFWLKSKFDSWYNSSGTAVRSKMSGERGYYVGSELSLRANYELNKNVKLESGYAHFFPGGYVKDSGAADDVNWLYSQATLKF